MLDNVKADGFVCLTAKCPKDGSLIPYLVWVDCLQQLIDDMTVPTFFATCGNFSRQILTLVPHIGPFQDEPTPGDFSSSEHRSINSAQIFEAISQFLYRFSERSPLFILFDDFQWCDKTSLELLRYFVARDLKNRKIFAMCVSRDTFLETENEDLLRFLSDIQASSDSKEVTRLTRLDLMQTTTLIRGESDSTKFSNSFCEILFKKSGGNPLFVREMLALLKEHVRYGKSTPINSVTEMGFFKLVSSAKTPFFKYFAKLNLSNSRLDSVISLRVIRSSSK